MALALGQAGTLKPEIKLAQALSEYEALLDDNQKATMRMYRRQQPPKLSDVMRLTAEIDRDNSGRSSRCVGQRLTNVLQSVQQFSCIADTIVGGSQSLIASGVWAAVKLTLQVASGWGSYFERLSALIMDVGRSSPRYEELAVLYSSSAGLQKVFCEYMVVVVGLCKKAIMFVRKPFLAQLPASFLKPFETEFGQLRAELDKLAATIHDEVLLASTKGQQLEIKYNSAFRSFMGKVSDKTSKDIADIKAFQRREKKVHFLNACSSYNHQTACKRARKLGTSSWIYNNSTYQGWARDSASSILWCTGILGAGKTVLTANVLENVVIQAPEAIVASFFCQYDDYESLKARTIIGSLIRQTLASLPAEAFDNLDTTEFTMLPADEMFQYIQKLLALHRKQCFIILDGMDECDQEELKTVTHFLEDILAANTTFHVFCSSRPDLYRHISGVLQPKYNISCSESNPEILRYIEDELGRRLESEDLCLGDPGLILNIRDALSKGSQGM